MDNSTKNIPIGIHNIHVKNNNGKEKIHMNIETNAIRNAIIY